MLSQLKARAPIPDSKEAGRNEAVTAAKNKRAADAEQQAVDRLTCDALCSLANGVKDPKLSTPNPAVAAVTPPVASASAPGQPLSAHGFLYRSAAAPVAVPIPTQPTSTTSVSSTPGTTNNATSPPKTSTKIKNCPKQHQLPLFLSKTYHMIDRCDPEVATWSASGDNFVVKNVEKFASAVLPLYFKHSNFSSFARQLNFYGFRKLRSDPILTNDVDPQTASYVRFYHEKFQKNKPELLHSIKRATKSDQQNKDDVDDLKSQVFKLKQCLLEMGTQLDRKIADINFEYNRRMTCMTAEYDKLAGLVGQLLQQQQRPHSPYMQATHPSYRPPNHVLPTPSHLPHYVPNPPLPPVVETSTKVMKTSASVSESENSSSSLSSSNTTVSSVGTLKPTEQQNKMESLSQVASLMANATKANAVERSSTPTSTTTKATSIPSPKTTAKRAAPDEVDSSESQPPPATRPKTS